MSGANDKNPNQSISDMMGATSKIMESLSGDILPKFQEMQKGFNIEAKDFIKGKEISLNKSGMIMITGCDIQDFEKVKALFE
jgi:hypothetical protein